MEGVDITTAEGFSGCSNPYSYCPSHRAIYCGIIFQTRLSCDLIIGIKQTVERTCLPVALRTVRSNEQVERDEVGM